MKIFITGQCTLHIGRMEHGNVGNAYVIVGLLQGLQGTFRDIEIKTTLQLTDELATTYGLEVISPSIYDNEMFEGPQSDDSLLALANWADLTIDLSGDLLGPNANLIYKGRLNRGVHVSKVLSQGSSLYVALGTSPGPFENSNGALETMAAFDLVFAREMESYEHISKLVSSDSIRSGFCTSFLYPSFNDRDTKKQTGTVGVSPSIWNLTDDGVNDLVFEQISTILEGLLRRDPSLKVTYFSHANGFNPELLADGELSIREGNDWTSTLELRRRLEKRFPGVDQTPIRHQEMANFVKNLDYQITGRIHASVSGHMQGVPTWMIDYRRGPEPLKNKGFMRLFGSESRLIGSDTSLEDVRETIVFDYEEESSRLLRRGQELRDGSLSMLSRVRSEVERNLKRNA